MAGYLDTALAPFTARGFYLLTWGTLLGGTVNNISQGVTAYKTLPRQQFGLLQSRLTPVHFTTSASLSSLLLATHFYFHPSLISSPLSKPHLHSTSEGRQAILIAVSAIAHAVNAFIVGPKTTKAMFERHRLERLEGKDATAASVSPQMEALNQKFTTLHGISSTLNLVALAATAGLGLAIAM